MSEAYDQSHMARALELARRGIYSTAPNPAVGCVIVRDGRVVGEGYHRRAGDPHAEVYALEAAGESARGATAYVSLEPCLHFGRTPPCTRALLAAGIARVVSALRDPNPRVAGAGLEELAREGVAVESGLLAADAAELNRGYLHRMATGRPWVTVKIGASVDGRTALASGASRWITGEAARADVQRLRARAGAVITGIGTVLADDPSLTVRDAGLELLGRRPLRVVLDSRLRIPADARVLDETASSIIFTAGGGRDREAPPAARNARIESLPARDGRVDLVAVLDRLGALECNEVLVEAGPGVAGGFLHAGLVDELVLYIAPCVLGDSARPMFRLPVVERMADRYEFRTRDVARIGDDLRVVLRPQRAEG
jgi:diaminohydroxyphosphoribosylaminopyrimidine deaminase/5-amino-6-(5-phosphoribosylamino)uracil reductase